MLHSTVIVCAAQCKLDIRIIGKYFAKLSEPLLVSLSEARKCAPLDFYIVKANIVDYYIFIYIYPFVSVAEFNIVIAQLTCTIATRNSVMSSIQPSLPSPSWRQTLTA